MELENIVANTVYLKAREGVFRFLDIASTDTIAHSKRVDTIWNAHSFGRYTGEGKNGQGQKWTGNYNFLFHINKQQDSLKLYVFNS